jgi:hypothetical protein
VSNRDLTNCIDLGGSTGLLYWANLTGSSQTSGSSQAACLTASPPSSTCTDSGGWTWTLVNAWQSGTSYSSSTPSYAASNGAVYKCTSSGTSSTGPTCSSSTCSDGAITYTYEATCGTWSASHSYSLNNCIAGPTGYVWRASVAGSTNSTEAANLTTPQPTSGTYVLNSAGSTLSSTTALYDPTSRSGSLLFQSSGDSAYYMMAEPMTFPVNAVVYASVVGTTHVFGTSTAADSGTILQLVDTQANGTAGLASGGPQSYAAVYLSYGSSTSISARCILQDNGTIVVSTSWAYTTTSAPSPPGALFTGAAIAKNNETYSCWLISPAGALFNPWSSNSGTIAHQFSMATMVQTNSNNNAPGDSFGIWQFLRVKLNSTLLP